jgi:hypothetical protein
MVTKIKQTPNKNGTKNAIEPSSFLRMNVAYTRYEPKIDVGVAKISNINIVAIVHWDSTITAKTNDDSRYNLSILNLINESLLYCKA